MTLKEKALAYQMFFGRPYLDEWKDERGVVENSDPVIARRLKACETAVGAFLNTALNLRYELLEDLRESGASEEEIRDRIRQYDNDILKHL